MLCVYIFEDIEIFLLNLCDEEVYCVSVWFSLSR